MKLMLTSDGLTTKKLFNEFVKLVGKPANEIKIVVIPTAAKVYGNDYKKTFLRDELVEQGFIKKNIKIIELEHNISYSEINTYDSIFIGGGNTFLLLDLIRKHKFSNVVNRFLVDGGVYVGISAGSIVAGPNIAVAGISDEDGTPGDENAVGLNDLTGMNIVNFAISPHMDEKWFNKSKECNNIKIQANYKIYSINDSQAVTVVDGKRKLIS
jgi:peptidase E